MLVTLERTATGVALIIVDAAGENQIAVARAPTPGSRPRTCARPRAAGPRAGDVVLVTHEIPTAAALEALRVGREGGAWTILNPAPADGLDRAVMALADVVTPNRGELGRLVAADGRAPGGPPPRRADPVRAARTLLEATADGAGARSSDPGLARRGRGGAGDA